MHPPPPTVGARSRTAGRSPWSPSSPSRSSPAPRTPAPPRDGAPRPIARPRRSAPRRRYPGYGRWSTPASAGCRPGRPGPTRRDPSPRHSTASVRTLPHTFTAPGGGPGAASGSSNWSGQVLTGGSATGVAGDWTVPAVVPSTGAQYSATWIGIDGTSPSGTLIQTGTEQSTVDGTTSYSAWVEELPDASVPIDAEVEPGDAMQSTVVETSADVWTVTLIDVTGSWEFSQPFAYTTPGASAEWIEEAPTRGAGPVDPGRLLECHVHLDGGGRHRGPDARPRLPDQSGRHGVRRPGPAPTTRRPPPTPTTTGPRRPRWRRCRRSRAVRTAGPWCRSR